MTEGALKSTHQRTHHDGVVVHDDSACRHHPNAVEPDGSANDSSRPRPRHPPTTLFVKEVNGDMRVLEPGEKTIKGRDGQRRLRRPDGSVGGLIVSVHPSQANRTFVPGRRYRDPRDVDNKPSSVRCF